MSLGAAGGHDKRLWRAPGRHVADRHVIAASIAVAGAEGVAVGEVRRDGVVADLERVRVLGLARGNVADGGLMSPRRSAAVASTIVAAIVAVGAGALRIAVGQVGLKSVHVDRKRVGVFRIPGREVTHRDLVLVVVARRR